MFPTTPAISVFQATVLESQNASGGKVLAQSALKSSVDVGSSVEAG